MLVSTVQQAKRLFKIVAGFTLLLVGIVMLVTPGPGWLAIGLGLAMLAAEYVWARRLLDQLKARGVQLRNAIRPSAASAPPARPASPAPPQATREEMHITSETK